jgi:hypothetical protein
LTRNGMHALVTHFARLSGKTCRHYINLYWAEDRKKECAPAQEAGKWGARRAFKQPL